MEIHKAFKRNDFKHTFEVSASSKTFVNVFLKTIYHDRESYYLECKKTLYLSFLIIA